MRITLNPVTSSMIDAVGLADDGRLAVRFRSSPSSIYLYEGVGAKELEEMLAAPSVGRWFVANVREGVSESVHETDVDLIEMTDEQG